MNAWLPPELRTAVAKDMKVTIEQKSKSQLGQFQAVGVFSTQNKVEPYDILDLFEKLPRGAQKLFNEIKRLRGQENIAFIDPPLPIGSSAYKSHSRNLALLKSYNALKQLSTLNVAELRLAPKPEQQVVMINPSFIRCFMYNKAKIIWRNV